MSEIQFLGSVSPKLYRYIVAELEREFHIQSYDFKAGAMKEKDGLRVILQFGEHFTHKTEEFFSDKQIEILSEDIRSFIHRTGENCKEVMIDEYFKRMAP